MSRISDWSFGGIFDGLLMKGTTGVCHNHLKQPLKIGEILNHQGTIPGNL